jgi:hypothetical protein
MEAMRSVHAPRGGNVASETIFGNLNRRFQTGIRPVVSNLETLQTRNLSCLFQLSPELEFGNLTRNILSLFET